MHTQSILSLVTEKKCSRCGEVKPASEFWRVPKTRTGLHSWCRTCAKAWHDTWRRSEKGKEVIREVTERGKQDGTRQRIERVRRERCKESYQRFKLGRSCLVCGETEVCCLDFHHLDPSTKATNGRSMWYLAQRRDHRALREEIKKCIVLCSNCHRKYHAGKLVLPNPVIP